MSLCELKKTSHCELQELMMENANINGSPLIATCWRTCLWQSLIWRPWIWKKNKLWVSIGGVYGVSCFFISFMHSLVEWVGGTPLIMERLFLVFLWVRCFFFFCIYSITEMRSGRISVQILLRFKFLCWIIKRRVRHQGTLTVENLKSFIKPE